ncbi:hypothetical protein INR49_015949 [Caranx melampygus]|nr:hypothetical protein INR49_015949 [Caranx melampygus]
MQLRTHGLWPDSVKPYPVLPLATSTARIRPCWMEEAGGGWSKFSPLPPHGRVFIPDGQVNERDPAYKVRHKGYKAEIHWEVEAETKKQERLHMAMATGVR